MLNIAVIKDRVSKGARILNRQRLAKRDAKRAWAKTLTTSESLVVAKRNADKAYNDWVAANAKAKELGV